jgi:hypothetical protein
MRNNMQMILIYNNSDRPKVAEHRQKFDAMTKAELVKVYNHQDKMGIVGARAQGIYLVALHFAFLKRFQMSPVRIEEGCIISLTGQIKLVGEHFISLENQNLN